jgi:hypothetical protein
LKALDALRALFARFPWQAGFPGRTLAGQQGEDGEYGQRC